MHKQNLKHLSDEALIEATHRAARKSNGATATLLAHLAELDRRKLYLAKAKPSMFQYVVDVLGLSESAAYMRINAARAARKCPEIFEMVASGALHLTAIKLVAPHLTDANRAELLAAVSHKNKRQIETELARRFPRADVPGVVRKLPDCEGSAGTLRTAGNAVSLLSDSPAGPVTCVAQNELAAQNTVAPDGLLPADCRGSSAPAVSTGSPPSSRYKVQFTVSGATHRKLRQAQQLLRHRIPNGDLAQVVDLALDVLLEREMKRQFGVSQKPRQQKISASEQKVQHPTEKGAARDSNQAQAKRSRHIPNTVRREVLERDGLQCSFVSDDGQRCPETGYLQLHHVHPFAKQGEHATDNIRVFCKGHNAYAAELDYGAKHMARYTRPSRRPPVVRDRRCAYNPGNSTYALGPECPERVQPTQTG